MREIILTVVFLLTLLIPVAAEEGRVEIMSLNEIWQLIDEKSPAVRAQQLKIESLNAELESMPVNYLPDLSVEGGYSSAINEDAFQHGPLGRLIAEWTLWDGGRTAYNRIYKEKSVTTREAEYRYQLYRAKSDITRLYLKAALLPAQIQILRKEKTETENFLNRVRRRVRIGKVAVSDFAHIKTEAAKIEARINKLENSASLVNREIKLLLNKDQGFQMTTESFEEISIVDSAGSIPEADFQSLPWVEMRKRKIEALEAKIEAEKRSLYYPRLSTEIYAGYGPHIDAIDNFKPETGLGIKVELPLFSRSDRSARLKSIKLDAASQQQMLQHELRMARIDYEKMISQLAFIMKQTGLLKDIALNQKKNLSPAYRDFSRGIKSFADMYAGIKNYYETEKEILHLRYRRLSLAAKLFLMNSIRKSNKNKKN